jgi:hypothetical protein
MHKDIVPRAFACDYTLVADLLKRVADSFREHRCLNSSRTVSPGAGAEAAAQMRRDRVAGL